jgi:hypothetical protein
VHAKITLLTGRQLLNPWEGGLEESRVSVGDIYRGCLWPQVSARAELDLVTGLLRSILWTGKDGEEQEGRNASPCSLKTADSLPGHWRSWGGGGSYYIQAA